MRFTLVSIDASWVSNLIERHDFRVRTQMKMNATEKGSDREKKRKRDNSHGEKHGARI